MLAPVEVVSVVTDFKGTKASKNEQLSPGQGNNLTISETIYQTPK